MKHLTLSIKTDHQDKRIKKSNFEGSRFSQVLMIKTNQDEEGNSVNEKIAEAYQCERTSEIGKRLF